MSASGKFVSGGIVAVTAAFGIGVYYAQVYGYYETFSQGDVSLTSLESGQPERIPVTTFEAIDADSSPIRYRACFTTTLSTALLTETFTTLDKSEPRNAPDWFECFDANQIGEDLKASLATAYMGQANYEFGIHRLVAISDVCRASVFLQSNVFGDTLSEAPPSTCHFTTSVPL